MSELVDKFAGGSSPAAGGPTTSDKDGDGGSRRNRDAESRIAQLTREKNNFRAAMEQQSSEVRELREQFAEMRGQMSVNGQPDKPISSWSEVQDIPGALKMGLNPESPNPDAVYNAMDEMIRRRFDSFKDDVLNQGRQEHQQADLSRQVEAEISQKFGDEARDTTSPLFERASAYAQQFKQRYGDDVLDRHPDMALDAFARAKIDLTAGESDRIKELEGQLESLKAQGSVEPGSRSVARQSDEVRDALKARDPKAAIRALGSVQSFNRR
jgi:hypothetical protein